MRKSNNYIWWRLGVSEAVSSNVAEEGQPTQVDVISESQ